MNDCAPTFLLIDIGNSRVKWGLGRQGRIEPGQPFATQHISSDAKLSRHWGKASPPAQVVVANVAGPDIANHLKTWTERRWGLTPQFVHSEAQGFGVSNAYFNPEKLGVDRWVALIAARHACTGPVCVADCGTAITVDALDSAGAHLGGVIAPGLAMMRRSLVSGTSDLPFADGEFHDCLARETISAIASGTRQALAGLIERSVRQTSIDLGSEPRLLLTGGDAASIASVLPIPFELRPELVLEGLLVIAGSVKLN
ncbi:MAG: type III pantothenate kinase [Candidatus Methylumidiphilus sp.]